MHRHHVDAELAKGGGWIGISGRRRDMRVHHHDHDKSRRLGSSCISSTEGSRISFRTGYIAPHRIKLLDGIMWNEAEVVPFDPTSITKVPPGSSMAEVQEME